MLKLAKHFSPSWAILIHYTSFQSVFIDLCNITLPSAPAPSKRAVVFNFPHQNPLCIFSHPHVTTNPPTLSTLVLSPECYLLRGTNLNFHRTIFSSFLFLPLFFHFLSTLFSDTFSLCSSHRERRSFIFPSSFHEISYKISAIHFLFYGHS